MRGQQLRLVWQHRSFIDFLRDVGKYYYQLHDERESVKKRIETGISYTEFAYQIMQGYDFYVLNQGTTSPYKSVVLTSKQI